MAVSASARTSTSLLVHGMGPRRLLRMLALVGVAGCEQHDGVRVVRRWPHDRAAFTQGLVYSGGMLYESTGLYGRSQLRKSDLQTGRLIARARLPANRFGEGVTLLGGRLYQLTWRSGVGYIYDARTLTQIDSFSYAGEGWGLTTDGSALILSDGTATLRFIDPKQFRVVRRLTVRSGTAPVRRINELEYVRGELFANILGSDSIARIDLANGSVVQWIDVSRLVPAHRRSRWVEVLNGIAFDDRTGHFFLTGKLWPAMLEVELSRDRR
jgi:glutaminyl-peptide cyclotransferase